MGGKASKDMKDYDKQEKEGRNDGIDVGVSKMPFMDASLSLEDRINDVFSRLSFDDMTSLCFGHKSWLSYSIDRLGMESKSLSMTDGPHGINPRLARKSGGATCFPTGTCRAATWNIELAEKFGVALALETRSFGCNVILGPGMNIIRTPLCGRNFEYQTEDPFLNSRLAVAIVKGIQSQKVAACIKHFVCNNQEAGRFFVDVQVSERALRELYYAAFEACVKEADAWSLMTCYNKVNGLFGSENGKILRETLFNQWHFRGLVMSDWGATKFCQSTLSCIDAGLGLEMPEPFLYTGPTFTHLKKEEILPNQNFEDNVRRILRVMFLVGLFDDPSSLPVGVRNSPEHQSLALQMAQQGMVLLKNEGNLLPLNPKVVNKLCVMGDCANREISCGGGSSAVQPPYEITALSGIKNRCPSDIVLIDDPAEADVVIAVVGLTHSPRKGESEGRDRPYFSLPPEEVANIQNASTANPNTVVVLINGTAVETSWKGDIPAIIEGWCGGQEFGTALASILFGDYNPSGKLPFSFPEDISKAQVHQSEKSYPGEDSLSPKVYYDEGIFVGYRQKTKIEEEENCAFPFGHGLSFTTFSYHNLHIEPLEGKEYISVVIFVDITNTGQMLGTEVVQFYVQYLQSQVVRPNKELKGFCRITVKPGETKTTSCTIGKKQLDYFNEEGSTWEEENGPVDVLIGSSSIDIRLTGRLFKGDEH